MKDVQTVKVARRVLFPVLAACLAGLTALPAARAAQADGARGFVSLFNGQDLTGWRVPEGDGGHWKVVDSVIDYDAESEAPGRDKRSASTATSCCRWIGGSDQHHGSKENGEWVSPPALVQFRNVSIKELGR